MRQPCARWEFDFENENIRGHWTGIFRDRDGLSTEVEFTETAWIHAGNAGGKG